MEGAIIALAVCIALSVSGAAGALMSFGVSLINALKDLNRTLKEKSQSEDCDKSEDQI